jgi:hypothetical protein
MRRVRLLCEQVKTDQLPTEKIGGIQDDVQRRYSSLRVERTQGMPFPRVSTESRARGWLLRGRLLDDYTAAVSRDYRLRASGVGRH